MPGYNVEWKYDAATNSYKRFNGGTAHIDWEFDKPQLTAKNVVILFAKETGPLDSEHHMFYQDIGTGKAIVFKMAGRLPEPGLRHPLLTGKFFMIQMGKRYRWSVDKLG